jgi:hypothetical protein
MKRIAILILTILLCTKTFNQEKVTSIGIEFSPTIRSLYGNSNGFIENSGLGYSAGLNLKYNVNKRLSIISGIAYEKKGAISDSLVKNQDGVILGNTMYKMDYNYLVLSVLGSITIVNENLYLVSGPFLAYLINRTDKTNSVADIPGEKINLTENSKRIDFGWTIGIGYHIKISEKTDFDLGIRENLGFINTSKGDQTIKTNSIGIRVGLTHNID